MMNTLKDANRPVLSVESCVLLVICLADLVFTTWLVSTQRATEGNPLMSYYMNRGWLPLVVAKATLIIMPLFIAEWARRHRPQFVRTMLRLAIAAYLGLLLTAFINTDMLAGPKPTPPPTSVSAASHPMR
jgi:hypothetical protein